MYKFIKNISKSSKTAEQITVSLERFAKTSLKVNDLKLAKITREAATGTLKIGNKTFDEALILMKSGKFEHIIPHMFGVKTLPKPLLLQLEREVSHLPEFHLARRKAKFERLKNVAKTDKTLAKFDGPAAITEADVIANPKMLATLNFMKGTVYKTLTFGTTIVAISASVLISEVNRHRANMTGCIRNEIVNGKLISCKVSARTCKNGKPIIQHSQIECKTDILDRLKSGNTLNINCSGIEDNGCSACEILNKKPPKDISIGEEEEEDTIDATAADSSDLIIYECGRPTFLDALGDISHNTIDNVTDFLTDKGKKLNSIFNILLAFLKYTLIVGGILSLIFIIVYGYTKVKKLEQIDDDDDDDYDDDKYK